MTLTRQVILTGDRTTGPLHLGHYAGSLTARVNLQHHADQYLLLADIQALTDNVGEHHKVAANVIEVTVARLECSALLSSAVRLPGVDGKARVRRRRLLPFGRQPAEDAQRHCADGRRPLALAACDCRVDRRDPP
jgi:hypothetical protein